MNRALTIITRHWKPLLFLNLAIVSATVGKIALSQRIWTAKAQLIMPNMRDRIEANLGRLGSFKSGDIDFSNAVNPLNAQRSILISNAVIQKVLAVDPEVEKFSRLADYKQLFSVALEEQSTTLDLSVEGSSQKLARQRTENWIKTYNQRLNELRQEDAGNRQKFNNRELQQAQQNLSQAQVELAQFQQNSGLVNSDEQIKGIVKTIDDLTAARYLTSAQAQANENRVKSLSERLNMSPTQAMRSLGLGENQDYQAVRSKLKETEIRLNELRATRTNKDPRVEDLLTERNELQRQLQQLVERTAGSTTIDEDVTSNTPQGRVTLIQQLIVAESSASAQRREAEQLGNQIAKLRNDLKLIPKNQTRLQELRRKQEIAEGVYQGLVAQVQQAKIDAFSAYPNVQVLEAPTVDPKPTSPKLFLAIFNIFLGSTVGSAALLFWLEKRNPLLSPKDLQSFNFPIVFCISRLKNTARLFNLKLERDAQVELEFQRLASAVSLQRFANRRLLITSSLSGEGKTTVTIGLAKALTDLGFRVLLVDGDYRKAELSLNLAVNPEQAKTEKLIKLLPSLDLLPTWTHQGNIAAEILQGKFEQNISAADAIGNYDCILIDSPPVSLTSEAALMAGVVSNVLFVVRPEICERNSAYSSLEQLSQYNAKVFGLVVNGVPTNNRAYPYPYPRKLIEASSISYQ